MSMRAHAADFAAASSSVHNGIFVFVFLLLVAAMNGVMTYGFDKWMAPMVSFVTYTVPLIAALLGYAWLQREER